MVRLPCVPGQVHPERQKKRVAVVERVPPEQLDLLQLRPEKVQYVE